MKRRLRLKIRTKILLAATFILLLCLTVSNVLTYSYVKTIIQEQVLRDNATKLEQTSSQIAKIQRRIAETAEYIISDADINKQMVPVPGETFEDRYFKKVRVRTQLQLFSSLNSSLVNIMIIRPDGEIFSNYSGYEPYFESYLSQPWYAPYREGQTDLRFSVPHAFMFLNRNLDVISYVVPYRNFQDPDPARYVLVLDMRMEEISNVFESAREDFERILLLNRDGVPIYDSGRSAGPWNGGIRGDDRYIELADRSMEEQWRQVALISKSRLYEKVNNLLLICVGIALASFFAVLLIMLPLLINITRPISALAGAMKRVAVGDLDTPIRIESGDEMELLGNGFNRMIRDLKELIESHVNEQKTKRKMQINLLLSQINPHFIYNTLNTVIYLSHARRHREVISLTKALIDILQNTVKIGKDSLLSTLREEVDIVNKYATIQHYRYPGRFRLVWDIPESLMSCVTLRMMLQPLVENALYHGIIPSDRDGTITVKAWKEDRRLHISVTDDGIGFRPEAGGGGKSTGIGLANIRERLAFHYGPQAGLAVESLPDSGATVHIFLPGDAPPNDMSISEL
jgi:two-component system sensor histidine kinase YesM